MIRSFFALLLAACLAFCGMAAAEAPALRVTATFYPLYIAAINVARDVPGIEIGTLAPPSAGCLHDYQMTTADRRTLADSDVLILNGAGLESFLDKVLPTLNVPVIDASAGIDLLMDGHDHDDHDDHEGHDHDHEANPHVWVSVPGMIAQVGNIADGLSAADPAHAGQYAANAAAYIERLSALDVRMHEVLDPLSGAPIVTFHEAFSYLARDYGLRVAALVTNDHNTAPSARQLAQVADAIRTESVRALFAEPQYDDASVEILSRETGVPVFELDPAVSGALNPTDYDAYIRVMEQNTQTLLEALR